MPEIQRPLLGLFFFFSGLVLGGVLISYSPGDPSWNTAADAIPQNWGGSWGALWADVFIQILGQSVFLFVLFLLTVARAYLTKQDFPFVIWRSITCLFGVCGLSILFAQTRSLQGGALGILLVEQWGSSWTKNTLCAVLSFGFLFFTFWGPIRRKKIPEVAQDPPLLEAEPVPAVTPRKLPPLTTLLKEYGPIQAVTQRVFSPPSVVTSVRIEPVDVPQAHNLPPLDLLPAPSGGHDATPIFTAADREETAKILKTVLADFGIRGEIIKVNPGPVVTLYELQPVAGLKSARVISLADDIARSMSAVSARVAVIPGRNVIGIELPNAHRQTVHLKDLFATPAYEKTPAQLALALGRDIAGTPVIADLARMPHLLIAGTTGSGKSVGVNAMILSLIYRLPPQRCKFIMIDPKMLELSVYDGIPHLLTPVVTDPKKAVLALKWTVQEMERRYRFMAQLGVRNIENYNKKLAQAQAAGERLDRKIQVGFHPETGTPLFEKQTIGPDPLPFVVVVVDEMADLMLVAGKEIEAAVQRLAQMARAAGIHLIMATQRPSVDVITGTIKANFPTRISFQVTSKIDSRTILGEQGAEQLLGQGDMLYMATGGRINRIHGPFVKDGDVEKIVTFLKSQSSPDYVDDLVEEPAPSMLGKAPGDTDDALYNQAVEIVRRDKKASTSYVQRHLQIGYNRAARLVERMESEGIISPANHAGKRSILS